MKLKRMQNRGSRRETRKKSNSGVRRMVFKEVRIPGRWRGEVGSPGFQGKGESLKKKGISKRGEFWNVEGIAIKKGVGGDPKGREKAGIVVEVDTTRGKTVIKGKGSGKVKQNLRRKKTWGGKKRFQKRKDN